MTETYNYWLSLIHSGNLDELEIEIKEEIFRLTPYIEDDVQGMSVDEAWDIAEGALNESF